MTKLNETLDEIMRFIIVDIFGGDPVRWLLTFLLIAFLLIIVLIALSFALKAYRTRHPKNPTSVRARVLSNDLSGGKVDVVARGREEVGNTYGRVAYHRLSFWCEETNEELNFTIGENDERYKSIHPGDEGTLTYSKKRLFVLCSREK